MIKMKKLKKNAKQILKYIRYCFYKKSKYDIRDYINHEVIWHKDVDYFINNKLKDLVYFSKTEQILRTNKSTNSNETKGIIQKLLDLSNTDIEKVLCYKFLERIELLSADDVSSYMMLIRTLDNVDLAYAMNIDLHSYVFRHKESMNAAYYLERKNTIKGISYKMHIKCDFPEYRAESKKVAILARTIQSIRNSAVSFYVLDDAKALAQRGYDVTVFVSGYYFYDVNTIPIRPQYPQVDISVRFKDEHRRFLEGKAEILYIEGNSIKDRIENCVKIIAEFNPAMIIDYSSQHAFETATLVDYYPILYVPLSGLATCDYFHKYMCPDLEKCIEQNNIYKSVNIDQMIPYNKPIRNMPPVKEFRRSDYSIKSEDFVIVTVGYRIKYELSNECIDAICELIKEKDCIRWILVTIDTIDYIEENYLDLVKSGRIINWGFEDDITGLYQICDAYINPNRTGGGASIAYAMHAGLPILMNDYPSDAYTYVGKENMTHNYSEMVNKLRILIEDKDFYSEQSRIMKNRANQYSVDFSISQYINAFEKMKLDYSR